MSRYHSYLNTAKQIISGYNGSEPLSSFLKKFFAADKKFGSRDRKSISHLCYSFFRMGKAARNLTIEERIITGLLLSSTDPTEILNSLRPEWDEKTNLSIEEKEIFLSTNYPLDEGDLFILDQVFPWHAELSDGIDAIGLCKSLFIQPYLYLRIRPGFEQKVIRKLSKATIPFLQVNASCIAVANGTQLEKIIDLDKEVVVQDLNSQDTSRFFESLKLQTSNLKLQTSNLKPQTSNLKPLSVWDCCAASGGKSILAHDLNPAIDLTVSDIRESILLNLGKRFSKAGISKYKSFIADLSVSSKIETPNPEQYDLIICDAPCTGSGTWSRTPEQLYYFEERRINEYAELQKNILSNIIPKLKKGGHLVYITCSVFKKENVDVVQYINENFHLELKKMEVLKGYDKKADTLFAALFTA